MQIPPEYAPGKAGATSKRSAATPDSRPALPYMPGVRASLLVVLLASVTMVGLLMIQKNTSHAQAIRVTATAVSTATPSPAPSPTSIPTEAGSMWGAPVFSFTAQPGTGQAFAATSITPDGSALLGNLVTPQSGAASVTVQPALMMLATRAITLLGVPAGTTAVMPVCCQTDGKYAIAADAVSSPAACAYCATQLWVANLASGTAHSLTVGAISGVWLSQGHLLVQSSAGGLSVTTLATGSTSTITVGGSGLVVLGFAWPLAIARDAGGSAHLLDVSADTENILSQAEGLTSAAFDGTTLIIGKPDASADGLDFASLANSNTPDPTLTLLGTFPDPQAQILSASDSVITFTSARPFVWDRLTSSLVALPASSTGSVTTALAQNYLVVIAASTAGSPSDPEQITVYRTSGAGS